MTRLEKQYEKPQGKSVLEAIREEKVDNQNCVKTVDKVEPNFNVGDWIIRNNKYTGIPVKVIEFNGYYSCDLNGEIVNLTRNDVHNNFHLWTIQDAKDGDILINKSNGREFPFLFKETKPSNIKTDCLNPLTVLGYCGIGGAGFTKSEGWGDTVNCTYYPVTKEQRDLLFQKMKEAGYEWDAEKKELRNEEIK